MKHFQKLLSLLLCAAMLLSLLGCHTTDTTDPSTKPVETTAPTEPAVTEPEKLTAYQDAIAAVEAATDLSLRFTTTKTTRVGGESFTQESRLFLDCADLGTDAVRYKTQEAVSYSNLYSVSYEEVYADGTLYLTADNDYRFSGTYTAEEMESWYMPAILVDPELYQDISVDGNTLTFRQPTAAEDWVLPEDAEMLDASGTVQLSDSGDLQKSGYTITYTYGSAEITLETEVYVTVKDVTIDAPADTDAYTPLECLEATYLLDAAVGYLHQAKTLSTQYLESTYSQAAGFLMNQSQSLYTYDVEEYVAKVDTSIYLADYAAGENQEYQLEETFVDGIYSYAEDGGEPIAQSGITDDDVRSVYDSTRTDNFVNFEYWDNAVGTDLGTLYLFEITLNDDYGTIMEDYVSYTIWDNADFLNDFASAYENGELTTYFGIDKYTGLPTATGYHYEGIHTIDGQGYVLSYQIDQSFHAPSLSAYEEITEEKLPETEPEVAPTPLFYHVTGADGQEMWLFGTIHVGDDRTAYLPQEIYDALGSSDALAVECDTEGFDQQAEEDEELQNTLSDIYYYSDGTTIQDHIDPELYDAALKYMKATGNYNINTDYLKPFFWYNSIDNYYLQQGYQLTGEQGVEERLTKYAEDNGIPLWEVESSMFQIQMMGGFSEDLAVWLLEGSAEYADPGAWEGSTELFELWCAGDEEAMRERLSCDVDLTELTEEELAEYEEYKHLLEEYNDAMSHDRNDGMLEVLLGYLESGDTVFVAVGLAHLLDETNGLVDTLRAAGDTVELVTFAN